MKGGVSRLRMERLCFALDVEDGWPPVATESVWCERVGDVYTLVNAPFFINGLAYGDTFIAEPDQTNGYIFEFQIAESFGHSSVWVISSDAMDFKDEKQGLVRLGCSIEGFSTFHLYAVNIPAAVDSLSISPAVDRLEALGFVLAFPVWRHEISGT